jgi:hypothetical protein
MTTSTTTSAAPRYFSAVAAADNYGGKAAAAKGVPYSRLTVGVPVEHHPLEKRITATPEVSEASRASHPPPLRRQPDAG